MEGKTIEIILYAITIVLSVCSGIYITIGKERYKDEKTVFSKEGLNILRNNIFTASIYTIISLIMFVGIIYLDRKDGYEITYQGLITIFQKFTLIPLLIITFVVDIKERIIPNRITMLLFQTGIFFTMLHCIDLTSPVTNLIYLRESIIGLLALWHFFGGIIAGKEAMGMGDIKFMAPIRIIFWTKKNIGYNITCIFTFIYYSNRHNYI